MHTPWIDCFLVISLCRREMFKESIVGSPQILSVNKHLALKEILKGKVFPIALHGQTFLLFSVPVFDNPICIYILLFTYYLCGWGGSRGSGAGHWTRTSGMCGEHHYFGDDAITMSIRYCFLADTSLPKAFVFCSCATQA